MAMTRLESSPVARHVLLGPHARFLPGCSAGQREQKPVVVSNSMMQTYVKMRGPCLGCPDDPLFEWIRLRDDLQERNPKPGDRKDITKMLAKVDDVLQSPNPAGDTPRDAIFEIERPPMDHIEPPAGMDLSIHVLSACCADFEFEGQDEDDEEGHVPTGRISPCTFLAWSKDCTRWDDDEIKVSAAKDAQRLRPPTPDWCDTPPSHPRPHRYPPWGVQQFDAVTGGEMSPHYLVPSSPSILYVPEGIDADRLDSAGFESKFNRMDPMAGKSLRKLKCFQVQDTASPTGENDHYAYSEVEELLTSTLNPLHLGFACPQDVQAHIGQKYHTIAANEAEAAALTAALREQSTTIRALEAQKHEVLNAVARLRVLRAEAEERQRVEKRKRRMGDHVRNHVSEVEWKHARSCAKVEGDRERREWNQGVIEELESDIFELCFEVGKICPEEVYEELNDGGGEGGYGMRVSTPTVVKHRAFGDLVDACKSKNNPFARYVSEVEGPSPEKAGPLGGG